MRTIEQMRAQDALARVEELRDRDDFKKLYRSYVDRFGPTIVMNGLGQALAIELAAAGEGSDGGGERGAHRTLYQNVQKWLCREKGVYPGAEDLLKAIMSNDESHYLRAQSEALAWLDWHKKFCRAYLPAD